MKLLSRTNRYYIFFSIITYLIIAGSFYVVVEHLIYREVEDRLRVERREFEQFVKVHGVWGQDSYFVEDKVILVSVRDTLQAFPAFKDTLLANRYDQRLVPFREYSFYSTIGGKSYKVSIRKSLIESYTLLEFITITMLLTLSVGLLLLFVFQRRISKVLWKPFYETLSKAKAFEVNDGRPLNLSAQDIFEFNELNTELVKMTGKISRDYKNLKEFTENASHEIQTPLALINSRVEELIQEKDLTPDQMKWIQDIHESTLRLSKLNHALLLLSKIDNGQFYGREKVSVNDLINSKLPEFEEIFNHKDIHLDHRSEGRLVFEMNAMLADILFTNLINNAVKHNFTGGKIVIRISSETFLIENTGESLKVEASALFERFRKENQASSSLGLGLAIVKKICDVHNLDVFYTQASGIHSIRVSAKRV